MDYEHGIKAYHNSYQTDYRNPFGAVICGQNIILRLEILCETSIDECILRVWEKDQHERILSMHCINVHLVNGQIKRTYEIEYNSPNEQGLVWYYFIFKTADRTWYFGNNKQMLGGQGELYDHPPKAYQITVHKKMNIPEWYKNGIMYQIFVDRFYNGNPNKEIINKKQNIMIHGDWQDTPFYIKTPDGKIARWNFFGGNLKGIIEKLPYLEELGVSIIYLNPIFEATSNHKYDTADYFKIDPMFGDDKIFDQLIEEAGKLGISVILDGVFSHTGSDSIYFNRYGNYPSLGAFQSDKSPYYKWYKFKDSKIHYDSWWGIEDLPSINKEEPSFQEFIYGRKDSVARYWIDKGVKGWRLDVVDELPGEFVKKLRMAVKETDAEAVLIGEVWEDASHKVSYGKLREYFLGEELDSVMNYPLRTILLDFMLEKITAGVTAHRVLCLLENYPRENFNATMNLLGSHDKERILTILGDAPNPDYLTEEEKAAYRLTEEGRKKGIRRLKALVLLQMTFPGVPCIYYGDEAGLEGYSDPYNRGTFPWGREDHDLFDCFKKLIKLRREYEIFNKGLFTPVHFGDDIFGLKIHKDDEEIKVYFNRSENIETQIYCDVCSEDMLVLDLLTGKKIKTKELTLKALETKVFYLKKIVKNKGLDRKAGILLPLASLPSKWGIGDMGSEARNFIDFLADSGQGLWQLLPLNPTDEGNSPYQSNSVFAGNTSLISLEGLEEDALLSKEDLQKALADRKHGEDQIDYIGSKKTKDKLFHKAFYSFLSKLAKHKESGFLSLNNYKAFQEENKFWLDDYCLYCVLKEKHNGLPWYEWEKDAAGRNKAYLEEFNKKHSQEIEFHKFLQYVFYSQWESLREYAGQKGIKIIGDLPIYVAGDSCDTWANKNDFTLDANGRASAIAGVPPDYFTKEGQLWGNPLYRWHEMEKKGFNWWKARINNALSLYDWIRLDHFRGFEAYWSVPAGEKNAVNGRWLKGPGKRFFEILETEFDKLPFIAEDLGFITPEVENLKNIMGYPGMKIYQFDQEEIDNQKQDGYENVVLYSSTHDTDTLLGWHYKNKGYRTLETEIKGECLEIMHKLYSSKAPWVILPMQDILLLDSKARMNTPGTSKGNWNWRLKSGELKPNVSRWLKIEAAKSGRSI